MEKVWVLSKKDVLSLSSDLCSAAIKGQERCGDPPIKKRGHNNLLIGISIFFK
jgi:hypothetical protein